MMMKKILFFLMALCLSPMCYAQVTTYSASDANQDLSVNIADINKVINSICTTDGGNDQVVKASDLSSMFQSILSSLNAIKDKLGIESTEETDTAGTMIGGHQFVDLGLPSGTKWATCNVGSVRAELLGDLFAWGEVTYQPTKTNDWSDYKWGSGTYYVTKYSTNTKRLASGKSADRLSTLQSDDDAATVNWGTSWCMPTKTQCAELLAYTTGKWTTKNGVPGELFMSNKNGKSIFFPAHNIGTSVTTGETIISEDYWSSTLNSTDNADACSLSISSYVSSFNPSVQEYVERSKRYPVRAVVKK